MRNYNFIYKKLVPTDDDFIGIIAYSLYKKQKIEYIENFVAQHQRDPTNAELDIFHSFTMSDIQLAQYKASALGKVESFSDYLLSTKAEELENFYRESFKEIARENGHGYWYAVWQGVVSSFLYTILFGLLIFFLWSSQMGPKQVIEGVFKVKITPKDSLSADSP